jgi:pimeloyl-ACP methyl ester carboxylesterase
LQRRSFLRNAALLAAASPLRIAHAAAPHFICVHGAMHGAWCWYKVLPRLRAAGASAVAIDLPGRGRNSLPRAAHTREAFVASVVAALETAPAPATLVAHDVAGLLASLAAQALPKRIARIVFVAAYIPRDGESLISLAQSDEESLLRGRTVLSRDRAEASVREDALREVLYADCSEEDIALAQARLVPEATQPFSAPPSLSAERFGAVAKSAVICTQDRALGPRLQRAMAGRAGCEPIGELDCGHAPFFAAPDLLAARLLAGA